MARVPPKGRSGPKLPYARMEHAVELKLLGCKWGEIERATNTPIGTLWRWHATEDWKAMEADWLARDPLVRLAKAIVGKALMQEFLKKGRPDTALAERILARHGNGDGVGHGYLAHPGVVLVPMPNKGLESLTATQVLVAPSTPRGAPSPALAETPRKEYKPTTRRRRIVGPDE